MILKMDVNWQPGWADAITIQQRGKSKLGRITKAGDSGKIHEHARIYRLRSVAGSQILNFMS
jgi:hypothetical protein